VLLSVEEGGGDVMIVLLVPMRTRCARQRIDTPPRKSERTECVFELRLR
jgi:hypothetical protein